MLTTEQVSNHENILMDAFKDCNLALLEKLLDDRAAFVYPNGMLFGKKNILDNYRSGASAFSSIATSEQTINLIGDTAVVSLVMQLNGKYKDQLIQDKFRYIRVWQLIDNQLKVIATSGVPL